MTTKSYFCSFNNLKMEIKRGEEITIQIDDFAYGGKGITKIDIDQRPYVIFTLNAIPGQTVRAKVLKKKKSFAECRILEILQRSEFEIESKHQPISGAPYISLPIEKQHDFKKKSTIDLFKRIGGLNNVEEFFDEFIPSPNPFHYRNKMEYSFSTIKHDIHSNEELDDQFALGFKHSGTWWKVEDLDKDSGMFDQEFENKLNEIREFLKASELPAWHPPSKIGFFRHLVVRKSFAQNKLLINLVTSDQGLKKFKPNEFSNFLQDVLGNRLAGFIHTVNIDVADRAKLENGSSQLIYGKEVIIENILKLDFEISMESFFQTNPASAEKLYKKVIEYCHYENSIDNQVLMDLFCGTGTIGQLIANGIPSANVIGVDIVKSSIDNAKKNAIDNKLSNIKFFAEDAGKFILNHPEYINKIGTIILDPPRAGIAPKTLRKVMQLEAKRIVYVSCNPSTQARDAKELTESGYRLLKFSLIDQFPHTGHIESIMLFEK